MDREPNKSLISGKRTDTVPVFGVSRNKILLVDSGQVAKTALYWRKHLNPQDFLLSKEKAFSDLSCLTCAQWAVRLACSVSNLTSPCNERTWNAKGTDTIMTSPEREPPKTSTKRSAALRSPTGITPLGIYPDSSKRGR